jgi:hypothetical protein
MPVKLEALFFCFPEDLVLGRHLPVRALVKFFLRHAVSPYPSSYERTMAVAASSRTTFASRVGFSLTFQQSSVVRLRL